MKLWLALILTLCIVVLIQVVCMITAFITAFIFLAANGDQADAELWAVVIGNVPAFAVVIGTALWMAFDSRRIELRKYKLAISSGPAAIFLATTCLWLVVFPWYLHSRYKITSGIAELKDEGTAVPAPVAAASRDRKELPPDGFGQWG